MTVEPEPVGPPGILILAGSTLAMTNIRFSIGADGEMTSSIRPQVAWEVWPLWLRIAIDHEATAARVRRKLLSAGDQGDGQLRAKLIEEETRAGMVAVSATAFTVEAMALSAAAHAELGPGIGRRASAARRAAETLKQCFAVPPLRFRAWRDLLVTIFDARNAAVHPDAGLRDPLPHPGVRAAVPRPAHVYRLENATEAVDVGLWTALEAISVPRPRLGKAFEERIASWSQYSQELRAHRNQVRTREV